MVSLMDPLHLLENFTEPQKTQSIFLRSLAIWWRDCKEIVWVLVKRSDLPSPFWMGEVGRLKPSNRDIAGSARNRTDKCPLRRRLMAVRKREWRADGGLAVWGQLATVLDNSEAAKSGVAA